MNAFKFQPSVTNLESREVPATFSFSGGNLVIQVQNSDYNPNFYRQANAVAVSVDYRSYGSQVEGRVRIVDGQGSRTIPVMARDVRSLTVNGTDSKDWIDVSSFGKLATPGTTPRNLDGKITINGRGNNDMLIGSGSFNTVFVGGSGADTIVGRSGNDSVTDYTTADSVNASIRTINGRRR